MQKKARIFLFRLIHLFINQVLNRLPFCFVRVFILTKILGMKVGRNTYIAYKVSFICPWKIVIGDNCVINSHVLLDGREKLIIKDNVDISWYAKIFTLQHDPDSPEHRSIGKSVIVDSFCWLATNAIILPGIHLGEGSIIAAGAVVTKNTLPFTVYGGIPAKPIKSRNKHLHYTITEPGIRI